MNPALLPFYYNYDILYCPMTAKIITTNRQASYNYHILESFEAGIQLKGSEVKSLRAGRASLKESFARIENGELYLFDCHISPYEHTGSFSVDPKRRRKLLVHKSQISRLIGQTSQKGLTIVPLKMYFKGGIAKVELALAKGKRQYDKRQSIKRKESLREIKELRRRR